MSQNLYLKFAILQIPSFRLLTEGSLWLHVCAFVHAMSHGRGFYFQFTCGGFNPFVPYRSHTKFSYMQNSFNLFGKRALSSLYASM